MNGEGASVVRPMSILEPRIGHRRVSQHAKTRSPQRGGYFDFPAG